MLLALPLLWLGREWALLLAGRGGRALGAEPVSFTIHHLGLWALRYLLAVLALSLLARLRPFRPLLAFRRMVGLFAFACAASHILVHVGLDLGFSAAALWRETVRQRHILVGMLAFLALVPLAVTSTDGAVRRIGWRGWRRLHRLVYPAAGLAAVHFLLSVKGWQERPLVYAGITAVLLGARLLPQRRKRAKEPRWTS